jgi:hypothetical protein
LCGREEIGCRELTVGYEPVSPSSIIWGHIYLGPHLGGKKKPGTGNPLHTQELVTVASFRTWRGWREYVAWDRYLTLCSLPSVSRTNVPFTFRAT